MEKEVLQEYKDRAWKAKNESEWQEVMLNIKSAVEGDKYAADNLRRYCQSILPKKKEWWEKAKSHPVINKPPVFREDVQNAMARAFNAIATYYEKKGSNI